MIDTIESNWKRNYSLTDLGLCPDWDIRLLPASYDMARRMDLRHKRAVLDGEEDCICVTRPLYKLVGAENPAFAVKGEI